jgi:hypothetical protein
MFEWLRRHREGPPPKRVSIKKVYKKIISCFNQGRPLVIHLCDYHPPNGKRTRAAVGPVIWDFEGLNTENISDDELVIAFCGWAMLTVKMQAGTIEKIAQAQAEKPLAERLQGMGYRDIVFGDRYRMDKTEILEFTGKDPTGKLKGATCGNCQVIYREINPEYRIPATFFLLGEMQNNLL